VKNKPLFQNIMRAGAQLPPLPPAPRQNRIAITWLMAKAERIPVRCVCDGGRWVVNLGVLGLGRGAFLEN